MTSTWSEESSDLQCLEMNDLVISFLTRTHNFHGNGKCISLCESEACFSHRRFDRQCGTSTDGMGLKILPWNGKLFFSSKHIENAFHFIPSFGDLVLHWILGEWQLGHESGLIWFCNEGSRHFCCVVNLLFAFWSFLIHHHITARASKEAPDLFPGRNPAVDWKLAHPKLLTKLWSHSCKCMQGIHRFQDCSARS